MKTITVLITIIIFLSIFISIDRVSTNEASDLPSFFSWQDIDGIDYTTPIKNQLPAPTCEAYALCASLETLMQHQIGDLYYPDLSETHLFSYAGGTIEAGYVHLVEAVNYLKEYGVPDEGCFPDPHRAYDYPFESLPGWENRTLKIKEWGWVENEEEAIKTALIEHGPLIICTYVWKDFFYYKEGVYTHRWGKRVGNHVMTLVGYNDSEECWIVKNSFGTNWGEDGWFKMSYDAEMFAVWYGRDGAIMYIDGVYGNLEFGVPRVEIETPKNYLTYVFGRKFKTILKQLPLQKAAPRIIGKITAEVTVENTDIVEFYIDDVKKYIDDESPFTWDLQATRGFHTLEVRAYNDYNISLDLVDFYLFI